MSNEGIILEDTIAAISTPAGESGIGIVRLSGKEALKIVDKIFISRGRKKPSEFDTYTVHYGQIIDPYNKSKTKKRTFSKEQQIIDEVLLIVMSLPKSYTKEDVVEISCHGGIVPIRRILDLVLKLGARLAEPGEFTKRAFINGRIDLAQAEAVLDIIRAKTDASLKIAVNHLEGDLSKKIREIRNELITILSDVEAAIDFVQEDIEIISLNSLSKRLKKNISNLKKLLDTAEQGIILTEGITTVICGKANVGKSSLMNTLLRVEKVIVTPLAGTTRDAIEELINIEGIPLRIVDTAGILEPSGIVERESILRSKNYLKVADLVLLVLDNSQPLSREDKDIITHIKDKKTIVVINKIDLPSKLNLDDIKSFLKDKTIVKISAVKGKNLKSLEKAITQMVFKGHIFSISRPIINNVRHKNAIRRAFRDLINAQNSVKKVLSFEFMAVDIKEAINNLGEITGETISCDILDRIFSNFCIGK